MNIEILELENKKLKGQIEFLMNLNTKNKMRTIELYELNSEFKQALEFYADEENWKSGLTYTTKGNLESGGTMLSKDDGEKARITLERWDEVYA